MLSMQALQSTGVLLSPDVYHSVFATLCEALWNMSFEICFLYLIK